MDMIEFDCCGMQRLAVRIHKTENQKRAAAAEHKPKSKLALLSTSCFHTTTDAEASKGYVPANTAILQKQLLKKGRRQKSKTFYTVLIVIAESYTPLISSIKLYTLCKSLWSAHAIG